MHQPWRATSLPLKVEYEPLSKHVLVAIPTEIWLEIIWQACRIPGVDEFSTDVAPHMDIYSIEGKPTANVTRLQLLIALERRLKMCFVCKGWASMAYRYLWSHLRIPLDGSSAILETLRLNPHLGPYVRRITTVEQNLRLSVLLQDFEGDRNVLKEIISSCPHVVSIHMPVLNDRTLHALPQDIRNMNLFWQTTRTEFGLLPQTLTSLTLRLSHPSSSLDSPPRLELPNLRALNIFQLTLFESWVDTIVNHWNFPLLQILVLSGGTMTGPIRILQKFASTLQTVRIYGRLVPVQGQQSEPLSLPQLRRLDIMSTCEVSVFEKSMYLPNLGTVFIYWPYYQEIPFFDSEKELSLNTFKRFLRALHRWCPPSATIMLEASEFVDWLVKQRAITTLFKEVRDEGRHLVVLEQETSVM